MYEISYGEKYEATKNLSRVQLAKLIREDIKAAVKAGELPKAKYSVTCQSYAGGGSSNMSAHSFEDAKMETAKAQALVDVFGPMFTHATRFPFASAMQVLHSQIESVDPNRRDQTYDFELVERAAGLLRLAVAMHREEEQRKKAEEALRTLLAEQEALAKVQAKEAAKAAKKAERKAARAAEKAGA